MNNPQLLAETVLHGFEAMFAEFMRVTTGAQQRFENAEWLQVHEAMRQRLTVYKQKVGEVDEACRQRIGEAITDKQVWRQAKELYAGLINEIPNSLIAESFFNSVFSRVFGHRAIRIGNVFAGSKTLDEVAICADEILVDFPYRGDMEQVVSDALERFALNVPYENTDRDVQRIAAKLKQLVDERPNAICQSLRIIESHFFRNKGAYLIGYLDFGDDLVPFGIAFMLNEKREAYADSVIIGADELSIIFSFTRSYFMVNAPVPVRYVAILRRMMPEKRIFELFTSIGFAKHGKTSFYRQAVANTRAFPEHHKYEAAPGIKGMVMLVFTLPEFDYVYKVIKDRFTPPKDMTRAQVEQKYQLVKTSDRAGRMADVYEFRYLAFDKSRFSPELLEELYREAPSLVEEAGNALVLKHCYVERKMTPLNLYLPDASDEETYNAIDEYGNAIKQLAAANIFPGDMLLKNFGVTRHGRVVFYDYDEICPLTECNFRKLPEAKTEEQEMAQGPWFDVAENDIFPEEFRLFFTGNPRARAVFNELHSDIYDYRFWQVLQDRINAGQVADVFPYRRQQRFSREGE